MLRSVDDALARLPARLLGALNAERGQTLAEYSLIVTIVAVAVTVLALVAFRTQIAGAFNDASNCLIGAC